MSSPFHACDEGSAKYVAALFRAAVLGIAVALLFGGCGGEDPSKAERTAGTFLDALAHGDRYACKKSSVDAIRMCYGMPLPEFRDSEITSVDVGTHASDASANPVGSGTVTAQVHGGRLRLHLQSTDAGDWLVDGIATSFPVPHVSPSGSLGRGLIPPA